MDGLKAAEWYTFKSLKWWAVYYGTFPQQSIAVKVSVVSKSPWNSPGQNTGVGSYSLLQEIFPTQGSNPGLPHCRWILYQLSHKENPAILEWVAYPFSSGSFQPRNQTGIPCIAGGFFTNWTIRETQCLTNPGNAYISLNPAHIKFLHFYRGFPNLVNSWWSHPLLNFHEIYWKTWWFNLSYTTYHSLFLCLFFIIYIYFTTSQYLY